DTHAFLLHTREVVYLHDGEVAVIQPDKLEVYDRSMAEVLKESETVASQNEDVTKGTYEHYTLKEIFEQPQTIRNALLARYLEDYGTVCLEELGLDAHEFIRAERVLILACGTSWHAGFVAAYMLEELARIPTQIEISSEFRYKNPIVQDNTLVVAISQSGETADTIAAMRELKAKGASVIAICNKQGSTLAREADGCIFLRAGAEIGVCSTKAFTSQLVVLSLFTLMLARMRHMSREEGAELLKALQGLPDQVQAVLNQTPYIQVLARKYARFENFFYLGRRYMYPAALEGALKLKEISYINANGYPAGEMKHGPIALIDAKCPTVAFCADKLTYEKTLSNLMEVKARGGPILAIAEEGAEGITGIADDVIFVPRTVDALSAIPSSVAAQLFAYFVAKERGAEIDQPRNLAKSVTVE
ncbi:MAG: glutamine--fructose-6-phosphate transaminase (isomerizing), partial [Chlamydiia bacterium]|nr:glutamine--fructose-6-phosphate transaminase (isomerizing) [Chlamydiia bacterium]